MTNWYYYNTNDEKVGPITQRELRDLSAKGVVTRQTLLETEDGRKSPAEQVRGLIFLDYVSLVWYYYDAKARKIGPMSFPSLQSLAEQGVIIAETVVEKDDVRTTAAKVLNDIKFAEPVPPPESLNWFYYDTTGQKTGPMSFTVLKSLAAQGVITRKTACEPKDGEAVFAGDIGGLKFAKPLPSNKTDVVSLVFIVVFFIALIGVIIYINQNPVIPPLLPEPVGNNTEPLDTPSVLTPSTSPAVTSAEPAAHTLELYEKIDAGMNYDDVVVLVGEPSRKMKDSHNIEVASVPGSRTEIYRWEVKDSAGAYFEVLFHDNEVLAKNQTGLK
ncbi:MAG: GYF domain-containing protein [Planctomycetaceae bacterium]|jgi:hypothetical protein|nr:GYF domain-containing protein [Planctomycetaceae bacterium]